MAFIEELLSGLIPGNGMRHAAAADLRQVTAPWAEPITLDEFKTHQKITHSIEDTDIALKMKAARIAIENVTGIGMMEQEWVETYDQTPVMLRLSMRPALSISAIEYVPNFESDTWLVYPSGSYVLALDQVRARTMTWPSHRGWKSFRVKYKVGYAVKGAGDAPATLAAQAAIPEDLKLAVKLLTSFFYENREGQGFEAAFVGLMAKGTMPPMVSQLLASHIDWGM